MLRFCLVSLIFVTVITCHLLADDTSPEKVDLERIVFALNNGPANDVAQTIKEVLADTPDVRVISSLLTNTIIIEAPGDEASKIIDLIRELDRPVPMVTIQATRVVFDNGNSTAKIQSGPTKDLERALDELQKQGAIRVVDRLKLTTLSNQEALIQVGQRTPNRTSQQRSPRGERLSSYQYENVGVLLRCVPRAARDGSVALDLQFEKSAMAPSKSSDESDDPPMTTTTTELQTTVRLLPDESVVLGGLRDATDSDVSMEWRVIFSAKAN